MAGCTKEALVEVPLHSYVSGDEAQDVVVDDDPVGKQVLFTVGNLNEEATTRADVIPYMANSGRFVCTMYYHSAATDTDSTAFDIKHPNEHGTLSNAWLMVNNTVGNSVYRKYNFSTPTQVDSYDFDMDATNFYWQNRLTHAFLALTDYHQLKTIDGDTATIKRNKLKMYPYYDTIVVDGSDVEREVNIYDLKRGTKTKMQDQPDPIRALTVMKPAGATQEANRVRLYFKHQFAQIQVNLKSSADNSANITATQIDSVQLLGVAEEGYVPTRMNANGTVSESLYKEVNLDNYTDAQLAVNEWGTALTMFDMANGDANGDNELDGEDAYANGFLKSFNAIAYGMLQGIRITWHETEGEGGIVHVTTFRVPEYSDEVTPTPLRKMASGKKYIYNLELQRGTLAVIRTQIVDWEQDENLVYGTDGTITN